LLANNYKVEVDDYFSYKEIYDGDSHLILQPIFNLLLSALKPVDYDYSRLILGLTICLLLSITIWMCRSRTWFILALTLAWYLESLAVIHIRMGLAFAILAFVYPRWRNPLWIIVLSLIHYSVLFYIFMYFIIRINRIQSITLVFLLITLYEFLPLLEGFSDFDQYRVYIKSIPLEYLELIFFGGIILVSLIVISPSFLWRLIIIAAIIFFSRLFLGIELGGRLSSILVLHSTLLIAFPILYKMSLTEKFPKLVFFGKNKTFYYS
jgi:hypothetical protein